MEIWVSMHTYRRVAKKRIEFVVIFYVYAYLFIGMTTFSLWQKLTGQKLPNLA